MPTPALGAPSTGAQSGQPAGPPALIGAMDAIRSGEVQEGQLAQRNAYFEQLSKQLKELRANEVNAPGANPPLPGVPPPSTGAEIVPAPGQPDPRVVGAPAGVPPVGIFPQSEVVISDDEEEEITNDAEGDDDAPGDGEELYEAGEDVEVEGSDELPDLTGIGQ